MRKPSLIFIAFLLAGIAVAQSKNPTNKKEIAQKQKQAKDALDKLTPEQQKMMEKMGVKIPTSSMPDGVTDGGVNAAVSGDAFGVPSKNNTLIGAIPPIKLTAATVGSYIKSLNDYIGKGIANDAKFTGENVYTYFKTNQYKAEAIGNEAVGFWTIGRPEIAVYMMGRACADTASDDDLLSNFAAMLSSTGRIF